MEAYIMPAIVLGLAVLGGVGTWFTLKTKMDELWERSKSATQAHDASQKRFVEIELRIERECVKKDDLERVEDRIAKRIDTVEHTVRNTATQIISALSGRRAPAERT